MVSSKSEVVKSCLLTLLKTEISTLYDHLNLMRTTTNYYLNQYLDLVLLCKFPDEIESNSLDLELPIVANDVKSVSLQLVLLFEVYLVNMISSYYYYYYYLIQTNLSYNSINDYHIADVDDVDDDDDRQLERRYYLD